MISRNFLKNKKVGKGCQDLFNFLHKKRVIFVCLFPFPSYFAFKSLNFCTLLSEKSNKMPFVAKSACIGYVNFDIGFERVKVECH